MNCEWVIIEDGELPVVVRNKRGLGAAMDEYSRERLAAPWEPGPTAKKFLRERGFEVLDVLPHPLADEPEQ